MVKYVLCVIFTHKTIAPHIPTSGSSCIEEECRQKAKVIEEKDEALKEKDGMIREKNKALSLKDETLRGIRQQLVAKEAECRHSDEVV